MTRHWLALAEDMVALHVEALWARVGKFDLAWWRWNGVRTGVVKPKYAAIGNGDMTAACAIGGS
jgi:hypothetical protein